MSFDPSLPYLGIRYTHTTDPLLEEFKNFLTSYEAPLIIVIEEADDEVNRTHSHSLIQTKITIGTFRKQLKAKFPLFNGNTDYQLMTVKDPLAMLRYVAKGKVSTPPQVLFSNLDSNLVAQAHLDYWIENRALKQSHKQQQKVKTTTWTEKCWEDVQKKVPPFEFARREEINAITAIVLQHLGSTARKLPLKIISDMVWGFVNALIIKYPDPKAFKNWSDHVADQIYANHPLSIG